METRRRFVKTAFKVFTTLGLFLSPGANLVKSVIAEVKKFVLPKDTDMKELIRRNPANLDTTNLVPTPLAEYRTMGLTSYDVVLNNWRLSISGLVKNPLSFTYEELQGQPSIERNVLLICPGFFAQHGRWKGVNMQQLLKRLQIESGATDIVFSSLAGPSPRKETFPLSLVESNQVFLAYQVNGAPLPEKHGFPLRVVAEGAFGSTWTKYVDSFEVVKNYL